MASPSHSLIRELHTQILPAVLTLGQVGSPATATRKLLLLPCSSVVDLLLASRRSRWRTQPPNPKQFVMPSGRKLNRFGDSEQEHEVRRREPPQQPPKLEPFPQGILSRPGQLPAADDLDPRSSPTGETQQRGQEHWGALIRIGGARMGAWSHRFPPPRASSW